MQNALFLVVPWIFALAGLTAHFQQKDRVRGLALRDVKEAGRIPFAVSALVGVWMLTRSHLHIP
jgi:hypothetical protein